MSENRYREEELIPIVSRLAIKYMGGEHTSISYEKAQALMEAVIYCIREYENAPGEETETCLGLEQSAALSAQEAYDAGSRIVLNKSMQLRELYHELLPEFCDYGMRCLKDTFVDGIPAFLRAYDVRYAPQETLLTLDYPVLVNRKDQRRETGIDAVFSYVQSISYEQDFLGIFEHTYILRVLSAYAPGYRDLVENLCEIVLPCIMGHTILRKSMDNAGFSESEYQRLKEALGEKSVQETEAFLNRMLIHLMEQGRFRNGSRRTSEQAVEYLCRCTHSLAVRIRNAVDQDCLAHLFLL